MYFHLIIYSLELNKYLLELNECVFELITYMLSRRQSNKLFFWVQLYFSSGSPIFLMTSDRISRPTYYRRIVDTVFPA